MATEQQEKASEEQSDEKSVEPRTDDQHNVIDEPEEREPTEKPEVTDEHREKAKEMYKAMDQDRPTIKLPGSEGAVAGTAINDWVDDDGNPKYSEDSKVEDEDSAPEKSDAGKSDAE
jgi:hypothetical protein